MTSDAIVVVMLGLAVVGWFCFERGKRQAEKAASEELRRVENEPVRLALMGPRAGDTVAAVYHYPGENPNGPGRFGVVGHSSTDEIVEAHETLQAAYRSAEAFAGTDEPIVWQASINLPWVSAVAAGPGNVMRPSRDD